MARRIDMTGERYGRLVVLEYHSTNRHGKALWSCRCDCGNEGVFIGENLRSGRTTSCGCYNLERSIKVNTTHGMTGTRLYECWLDMKKRCYNPNNKEYSNYGQRGIRVCGEWENDFEAFMKWSLNTGYDDTLTLDRIDVEGDYTPDNCRWSTWSEQGRNKRLSPNNSTGVRGAHFDPKRERYIVRIGVAGKRRYVGSYATIEEARRAREEAERKYWG